MRAARVATSSAGDCGQVFGLCCRVCTQRARAMMKLTGLLSAGKGWSTKSVTYAHLGSTKGSCVLVVACGCEKHL